MCGGSKAPQDNSDKVAAINAQAAAQARADAAAAAQRQQDEFNNRLNSAYTTGIQSAKDYFQSRGLDPNQYISDITTRANAAKGSIPNLDASPQSYFNNLGQMVWDSDREALQNKNTRTLNTLFGDGYSTQKVGDTLDDDTLAAILGEQQTTADQYVKNLLDRGVITQSGYDAASKNVASQAGGAKARLGTIGSGVLANERTALDTIINGAKSRASTLDLGDTFDPYSYSGTVDKNFNDFLSHLGDTIRGQAPTDLFSTAGLAGIAGASQGAGNTAYDPNAVAGLLGNTKKDDDNPVQQTSSPF